MNCITFLNILVKLQAEVSVVGRIECDADARLNHKSVVLQGTWEQSLSQTVPVDLDKSVHFIIQDVHLIPSSN